jgi:hypothetical protein
MLSEKFFPPISPEQFAALIEQDEDIFNTYQKLEICEWGIYMNNGYIIDTSGLLFYGDGVVVVQISLHKDSDSIWRIQGFYFRLDVTPTAYGLCK